MGLCSNPFPEERWRRTNPPASRGKCVKRDTGRLFSATLERSTSSSGHDSCLPATAPWDTPWRQWCRILEANNRRSP